MQRASDLHAVWHRPGSDCASGNARKFEPGRLMPASAPVSGAAAGGRAATCGSDVALRGAPGGSGGGGTGVGGAVASFVGQGVGRGGAGAVGADGGAAAF